jgi:hypothetical protein
VQQVVFYFLTCAVSSYYELFRQLCRVQSQHNFRRLQGSRHLPFIVLCEREPKQVLDLELVIVVVWVAINQATRNMKISVTVVTNPNYLLVVAPVQQVKVFAYDFLLFGSFL